MTVLFEAAVPVHYGFIFLGAEAYQADLAQTRAGQQNGLCGAAVPGVLSMTTGLHTGDVPFVLEWHEAEPAVDDGWEEVVEVSFEPARADLVLHSFEDFFDVRLPAVRSLRARYCASGMDAARAVRSRGAADRYLLALWPAKAAPEAIVRQTSEAAAYRHRAARGHAG